MFTTKSSRVGRKRQIKLSVKRETARRVWYDDNARPRSGAHALACLPTSTIKDTVVLSLNLTGKKQGNFAFYACSDSAHSRTGSRPAVVYIDASADGGATYTGRMQIGDSTTTFPRRPTLYKLYQFALPATTDNKASVKVRLIISRGAAGAGTVARFVMDDVSVTANTIVSTESEATNTLGFATYPNPTSGRIAARWMAKSAETTNATVSDILGRVCFTQQLPTNEGENIAELSLNLPKGVYFVRMSQAGNNGTQKIIIE